MKKAKKSKVRHETSDWKALEPAENPAPEHFKQVNP
jgi:hypothetical protein